MKKLTKGNERWFFTQHQNRTWISVGRDWVTVGEMFTVSKHYQYAQIQELAALGNLAVRRVKPEDMVKMKEESDPLWYQDVKTNYWERDAKNLYLCITREEYLRKARERATKQRQDVLDYALHSLEGEVNRQKDELAIFNDKLSKDFISTLEWRTEKMIIAQVKAKEAEDILTAWNEWGKDDKAGFLKALIERKEKIVSNLLSNPYRHSSTSLMANAIEEWKKQALSDMVSDRFGGGLICQTINALEGLLKEEEGDHENDIF